MLVNSVLSQVAPFVSVVESDYGFTKTYFEVSTNSARAVVARVTGVVVNCSKLIFHWFLLANNS